MSKPLIQSVAEFLGFELAVVQEMAGKAQRTYRHYKIPKKKKGMRTIHHPSKETKSIQYALMQILAESLKPHDCAFAFKRKFSSPLRMNAETHARFGYSLRIDFKDFFPSIKPDDLFAAIGDPINPKRLELLPEDREFLTQVFFVKLADGSLGLPIGAPSSPMLSNGVMWSLDVAIDAFAKSREFVYTRYADDLVFSTAQKGASKAFLSGLRLVISRCENPKLTINEEKTLFMSRNCRRVVTGMTIDPSGSVSVGRSRKRYIRKLLNDFRHGSLIMKQPHILQGNLAFILDVEPQLYDRLCLKYGAPLVLQALRQRGDQKG